MEFITHLPTTTAFVTNMAFLVFAAIAMGGLANLLALVLPTRQDRTWELHMQQLTQEYWDAALADILNFRGPRPWETDPTWGLPEPEPEVEVELTELEMPIRFSSAAQAVFKEVQLLAQGRFPTPPHLPEALRGVPTLGAVGVVHARWRPIRRRRMACGQDRAMIANDLARVQGEGLNW